MVWKEREIVGAWEFFVFRYFDFLVTEAKCGTREAMKQQARKAICYEQDEQGSFEK